MDMSGLPNMYTQSPRAAGQRAEGVHIRQTTSGHGITDTVEPLNNGHFGTSNFWHNFTVIERLSSFRGKIVLPWSYRDHKICPL